MKRLLCVSLSIALLMMAVVRVHATEQKHEVVCQRYDFENGLTMIDEITIYEQTRATDKRADRKKTLLDGNVTIAVIVFEAVFRYDGSNVSVLSKTVTRTDTYEGWSYKQNSFTSSGGTVTLNAKISKLLIFNNSFTMTLSCDKNGNISYT